MILAMRNSKFRASKQTWFFAARFLHFIKINFKKYTTKMLTQSISFIWYTTNIYSQFTVIGCVTCATVFWQ